MGPTSTICGVKSACPPLGQLPRSATGLLSLVLVAISWPEGTGEHGRRRSRFLFPTANRPAISAGIISSCSPLFLRLLLCVPSVEGSGYMRHLVFWTPLPSKLTGHEIIISHVIGGVKRLFHSVHSAEQHSRRSHLLPGETWFHLLGSLHDDVAPLLLRRSLSPHRCQPAEC